MSRLKKVVALGRKVVGMLAVTALIVGNVKFTSLATNLNLSESEDIKIEVMEAKLIEDLDSLGEVGPYTMLADCIIGVSKSSEGMAIDITTGVVGKASVLGVKDVKVQKKTWYGGWTTVAVSDGREAYNRTNMGISLIYTGAEEGATYRITCIHYADVNGYIEGENNSGEFVYSF